MYAVKPLLTGAVRVSCTGRTNPPNNSNMLKNTCKGYMKQVFCSRVVIQWYPSYEFQIALTRICCVVVQSCWGMLRDNRPLNLRPFFCLWQRKLEGSSCSPWWRCLLQRAPVRTPAGLKSVHSCFEQLWPGRRVDMTSQLAASLLQYCWQMSSLPSITRHLCCDEHLAFFLLSWPFHSIGKASLGIQIWVLLASVCRETSCIAALFKSSMHCMRQCVLCRTSNDVTRIAVFTSFRMFSEFRECFVGLFPIVCAASWHLCTLTDFGSPLQIHDLSRCSDIWLLQQAVLEWMTFSKFHLQTVRRYQFFCVSE